MLKSAIYNIYYGNFFKFNYDICWNYNFIQDKKMKFSKIIPVDKFINRALYDKKKGYYLTKNPFGKYGDFITSPGISPLFSEMIAIWIISFWNGNGVGRRLYRVHLG